MPAIVEALAATPVSGSGPFSQAVTLPPGTVGVVCMWAKDGVVGTINTNSFGNIPLDGVFEIALGGGSTSNTGRAIMYDLLDISGRDDDVLRWTGGGSYVVAVYAITGTGSLTRVDSGNGLSSDTLDTGGLADCVAAIIGAITRVGASVADIDVYGTLTETSEDVAPGTGTVGHFSYADDVDSTVSVGVNSIVANSKRGFVAALYSENIVDIEPGAFGSESGWEAVAFGDGGDMVFAPVAWGSESGWEPAVLDTVGPMQVMLSGPGTEVHALLTQGGIEGQHLTYHENARPSWGSGSETAGDIAYDNSGSGLTGDTVQEAIDELAEAAGNANASLHIETVSGAHDIDRADGATHLLTLSGDATFTPVGTAAVDETIDIRVHVIQALSGGPHDAAWDGSIVWEGSGSPPTMPTGAGDELTVGLESTDQGTTWRGFLVDTSGSVVAALDDLTDVTIGTPVAGDRLRYDGSEWANSALIWYPLMALDPTTGLWCVVVDGSGTAVMAEG